MESNNKNNTNLQQELRKVKLSGFDVIKEVFEKNTDIEADNSELVNNLKASIKFGWDDQKNSLALRLEISITRKVDKLDNKNSIQSRLDLVVINLFEYEDINEFIKDIERKEFDDKGDLYEIANYLLDLSYPKVKSHIENIFKSSNMKIKLPESLKVGD